METHIKVFDKVAMLRSGNPDPKSSSISLLHTNACTGHLLKGISANKVYKILKLCQSMKQPLDNKTSFQKHQFEQADFKPSQFIFNEKVKLNGILIL